MLFEEHNKDDSNKQPMWRPVIHMDCLPSNLSLEVGSTS